MAACGPTLAARSRCVGAALTDLPRADDDLDRYAAAVDAAVRTHAFDVVVPAGDAEAFAVSVARDAISCDVPYPPHDSVATAFDKAALATVAESCGVAVPRSPAPGLPAVVKGRSHVAGRHEAVVVRTEADLDAATAALDDAVVQEFVDGALVSFAVVADRTSRIVARVQQQATRVWPVTAGVSTRAETVAIDPALAAAVERLVSALRWTGLAQFQFLVPADGVPRLIDCNGRLYGSLSLAVAAGVNLPALWLYPPTEGCIDAPPGRRYQWLEGDLRRAVAQRDPVGAARSLAYALRAQHSILRATDPMPAVAHVVDLAGRAMRRARR